MTDPINVPDIPYLTGPAWTYTTLFKCPSCGWEGHDCLEMGRDCPVCKEDSHVCPNCGYENRVDPAWPDPIDPTGKRPDEWAAEKGHLILAWVTTTSIEDDNMGVPYQLDTTKQEVDPDRIPFAFSDAGSRRLWPNPAKRPDYKISEAAYDAAIASGPWTKDARPMKVPVNQIVWPLDLEGQR